jgi:hypothetical protein
MLMLCAVMTAWGETVTIWSEDWSSTASNIGLSVDKVVNENATYAVVSPGASLYNTSISAGGPSGAPELMIKKSNGTFKATIKSLKGCTGDLTLSFYSNKSNKSISLSGSSNVRISNYTQSGKKYTYTIKNAYDGFTLSFVMTSTSDNARLDDICLTGEKPSSSVTLNSSGFATYASTHPLDFSNTSNYTAWQITGVSGNVINFQQITCAVAAGTGVFLKGTAGESVEIPFASTGDDISKTNKLEGITAATDILSGKYYGLSGSNFVMVNAGTVPAGKALLPASVVGEGTQGGHVKALMFVFDHIDGVRSIETVSAEAAAEVFNLAGQRISSRQPGINIVNGKKVLVK